MTIYGKRLLRLYDDPRYGAVRNILEAMLLNRYSGRNDRKKPGIHMKQAEKRCMPV